MASITKRGDKWRVQIRKKGISKSAMFRTKTEAQKWAYEQERKIFNGDYDVLDAPLAFVIDKYIREVSPTKRGYRSEKIRLLAFMDLPIAQVNLIDLNEDHFKKWRDDRLSKVSDATVLREWGTLSSILNYAINEWKYLKQNPLKSMRKPPTPKARTRRLTPQEIDILTYSSGYQENQPPETATARVGIGILFAIETAMRQGEICRLTWDNVDYQKKIAHLPITKNGYSRDVPLSNKAIALLKTLEKVKQEDESLVFQINTALFEALFRKLRDRSNIKDLHFHDTRREALSRLAEKVDVMTLAKISGHRDVKILLNTYYAPNMTKVADLIN